MEVKRSNPKAFEIIVLKLKELEGVQARVGWFEKFRYPDGTPVAYAAALNEFGHGKTPARPFFRPTISDKKDEWIKTAASVARAVLAGKASADAPFEAVAQQAEGDVVDTINKIFHPELSPITIELRAMKKRDPSLRITAATVGIAAAKVKQPGYVTPSVNTKPLVDTGLMVRTITHIVEKSK